MHAAWVLVLPGLGTSGPGHWQTQWQLEHGYQRVEQANWDKPSLPGWPCNLHAAVNAASGGVVLVGDSLACSLVAHYAKAHSERVLGAFLVSPADVESKRCTPDEARCFSPIPLAPLPFPAHVVASADDPYVDFARAEFFAASWGASFTDAGACGHINASSGLGAWPEGHAQFRACLAKW